MRLLRIARLAIEVDRLRRWKDALRAARVRFDCERERWFGNEGEQEDPCWKTYRTITAGYPPEPDYERLPEWDWCESCRRRQRVHERLAEISRRLAGRRGALTRTIRNGNRGAA